MTKTEVLKHLKKTVQQKYDTLKIFGIDKNEKAENTNPEKISTIEEIKKEVEEYAFDTKRAYNSWKTHTEKITDLQVIEILSNIFRYLKKWEI